MIFSLFDTSLASVDTLLLFVIALLEVLFYYFKKKDKSVSFLKGIIPVLIIGLVIFLTIKGVVQDYFFIISIGMLSVFYIYVVQTDYKPSKKMPKKTNYKKSDVEDNFPFKSSIEKNEISGFVDLNHDKTEHKNDSESFEALIGKIYEQQKKKKD